MPASRSNTKIWKTTSPSGPGPSGGPKGPAQPVSDNEITKSHKRIDTPFLLTTEAAVEVAPIRPAGVEEGRQSPVGAEVRQLADHRGLLRVPQLYFCAMVRALAGARHHQQVHRDQGGYP